MMLLTRRFAFSSAHRLLSPALSAAENEAAFGACQHIHGHNYRLEVTIRGEPDPRTGFFCNVLEFAAAVEALIVQPSDHRMLNEVALYVGAPTTMEGLASRIWQVLEPALASKGMQLATVKLGETEEHWVTLQREA